MCLLGRGVKLKFLNLLVAVDRFEEFCAPLYGRFLVVFAPAQLLHNTDTAVLFLVAFERPVDSFGIFYFNYEHINSLVVPIGILAFNT